MIPSCESFVSVFVLLLIWGFKWGVVFPLDEMIPLDIVLPFLFFIFLRERQANSFLLALSDVCMYLYKSLFQLHFFPEFMEKCKCSCLSSPPWFGRCVTPPRLEDIACVIYSGEGRDTELDYLIWELSSLDYLYALKHLWSTKYTGKMENLSWWDKLKD